MRRGYHKTGLTTTGPGRASFVLRPVIYLVQIGLRYTGRFNGQTMSQPGIKQNKNDTSIRQALGDSVFYIRACVVNILALEKRVGEIHCNPGGRNQREKVRIL